jgi:hypothetical protein
MINKTFGCALAIGLVLGGAAGCATKGTSGEVEVRPAARPSGEVVHSARTNTWSTNATALFDGKTLRNWATTDFAGGTEATVDKAAIQIGSGAELSGITWTNGSLPKTDYEISLDAMKVQGSDFFCALTFPVRNSFCSLILGGWGGSVVGLSSIDGMDASENETTKSLYFACASRTKRFKRGWTASQSSMCRSKITISLCDSARFTNQNHLGLLPTRPVLRLKTFNCDW